MLDVRRLRVLREIARHGTIAAAARALHFSASAVSQQIAVLEREANAVLLERNGRSVRLTEAGRMLVARAETIFTELEAAAADLDAGEGRFGGELRCAAFPTAAAALLAPALSSLHATHPVVTLSVRELEPELALAALLAGHLDLAVAHDYDLVPRQIDPALHPYELFTEPLYVALPRDHPHATTAAPIKLAVFSDERWISPPEGLTCREELLRACAAAGFEPQISSYSYTYLTTFALVAAGLGIALVPALSHRANPADIALRPVADPIAERRVFAAVRKGAAHRPSLTAALNELTNIAELVTSGV
jgi:molybdate transport repressor ModE-like protein